MERTVFIKALDSGCREVMFCSLGLNIISSNFNSNAKNTLTSYKTLGFNLL